MRRLLAASVVGIALLAGCASPPQPTSSSPSPVQNRASPVPGTRTLSRAWSCEIPVHWSHRRWPVPSDCLGAVRHKYCTTSPAT